MNHLLSFLRNFSMKMKNMYAKTYCRKWKWVFCFQRFIFFFVVSSVSHVHIYQVKSMSLLFYFHQNWYCLHVQFQFCASWHTAMTAIDTATVFKIPQIKRLFHFHCHIRARTHISSAMMHLNKGIVCKMKSTWKQTNSKPKKKKWQFFSSSLVHCQIGGERLE